MQIHLFYRLYVFLVITGEVMVTPEKGKVMDSAIINMFY